MQRHLSFLLDQARPERRGVTALTAAAFTGEENTGMENLMAASFTAKSFTAESVIAGNFIPPEFNPKDWLTYLIHVDAELEHSLMVQYLYAAYSLGGDHVPADQQQLVKSWQEVIMGIAKEEMGHFVSVQNVLRVIGAPLNFSRQDFPYDSALYPFDFTLEPLTKASLAKYVYAESPQGWLNIQDDDDAETKEIKQEIKNLLPEKNIGDPISVLFNNIINLLEDEQMIPDEIFGAETYPFQAKPDEWQRGYENGARGNSSHASPANTPNVLVVPLTCRTDTVAAVKAIAEQGENPDGDEADESHFQRFLNIYKAWRKLPDGFNPARNILTNPYVAPEDSAIPGDGVSMITDLQTKFWANLFNVRYRMLLNFLTHSFLLGDGYNEMVNSPRGMIIHATFGEMYNLRTIANVLVNRPAGEGTDKMAGPPFLAPYTLDLPFGEKNKWRVHKDLLNASAGIMAALLAFPNQAYSTYLYSLQSADNKLIEVADAILNGVTC
jgi:hypothetical protein